MKENKGSEEEREEKKLGWEMKRSGRSSLRVRDKKGRDHQSRPRRTNTQTYTHVHSRQGRKEIEGWRARWENG